MMQLERAGQIAKLRAGALTTLALLMLCVPVAASAQIEESPAPAVTFPEIIPHFGQNVADDAEVAKLVGRTEVTFESCPSEFHTGNHRRVQLHLGKSLGQSLFNTPAVADALLAKAARAAWDACPQPFNQGRIDFHYNIEAIEILDADGSLALSAALGQPGINAHSDDLFSSGREGYAWFDVADGYTAHQKQIAREDADGAQAAQLASDQEQRRIQREADSAAFATGFWRFVKIVLGSIIAIWLIGNRQAIAEWFYALTPHPSSTEVDNAIYRGLPIDGKLFAAVNQPFDGNKYEVNVRSRQANALTERLRRHEAALSSQSEAILRQKRAEVLREQEFLRAHEALINAGVDHEVAAAHLAALRKATGQ